jgi:hypothetical protein
VSRVLSRSLVRCSFLGFGSKPASSSPLALEEVWVETTNFDQFIVPGWSGNGDSLRRPA